MKISSHLSFLTISLAIITVGAVGSPNYPRAFCSPDAIDEDDPVEILSCGKQFETNFEIVKAAVLTKHNLNRLRKAFFTAPNSNTVFLKIVYVLSLASTENATILENETKFCDLDDMDDNQTYAYTNETIVTYVWTSSGIFKAIHPLVLRWMNFQIPYTIFKLIHITLGSLIESESASKTDFFLWDGTQDLPAVILDVRNTSFPCIPSDQQIDSVLQEITSLVKLYASRDVPLYDTSLIGFPLDKNVTSLNHMFTYGISLWSSYCYTCQFLFLSFFCCYSIMSKRLWSAPILLTPEFLSAVSIKLQQVKGPIIVTAWIETICVISWYIVWSIHSTDIANTFYMWSTLLLRILPTLSLITVHRKPRPFMILLILTVASYIVPVFITLLVFPTIVIVIASYFAATYFAIIVFCGELHLLTTNSLFLKIVHYVFYVTTFLNIFYALSIILYIIAIAKTSVITLSFHGLLAILPTVGLACVTWWYKKTRNMQVQTSASTQNHERTSSNTATEQNSQQTEEHVEEQVNTDTESTALEDGQNETHSVDHSSRSESNDVAIQLENTEDQPEEHTDNETNEENEAQSESENDGAENNHSLVTTQNELSPELATSFNLTNGATCQHTRAQSLEQVTTVEITSFYQTEGNSKESEEAL